MYGSNQNNFFYNNSQDIKFQLSSMTTMQNPQVKPQNLASLNGGIGQQQQQQQFQQQHHLHQQQLQQHQVQQQQNHQQHYQQHYQFQQQQLQQHQLLQQQQQQPSTSIVSSSFLLTNLQETSSINLNEFYYFFNQYGKVKKIYLLYGEKNTEFNSFLFVEFYTYEEFLNFYNNNNVQNFVLFNKKLNFFYLDMKKNSIFSYFLAIYFNSSGATSSSIPSSTSFNENIFTNNFFYNLFENENYFIHNNNYIMPSTQPSVSSSPHMNNLSLVAPSSHGISSSNISSPSTSPPISTPMNSTLSPSFLNALSTFFNSATFMNSVLKLPRTAQVHISYLSKQVHTIVTEDSLYNLFSNFGPVTEVSLKKVSINTEMFLQNGYGFVHFPMTESGIESALNAVNNLHQITIHCVTYDCSISNQLKQVLNFIEKSSSSSTPTSSTTNLKYSHPNSASNSLVPTPNISPSPSLTTLLGPTSSSNNIPSQPNLPIPPNINDYNFNQKVQLPYHGNVPTPPTNSSAMNVPSVRWSYSGSPSTSNQYTVPISSNSSVGSSNSSVVSTNYNHNQSPNQCFNNSNSNYLHANSSSYDEKDNKNLNNASSYSFTTTASSMSRHSFPSKHISLSTYSNSSSPLNSARTNYSLVSVNTTNTLTNIPNSNSSYNLVNNNDIIDDGFFSKINSSSSMSFKTFVPSNTDDNSLQNSNINSLTSSLPVSARSNTYYAPPGLTLGKSSSTSYPSSAVTTSNSFSSFQDGIFNIESNFTKLLNEEESPREMTEYLMTPSISIEKKEPLTKASVPRLNLNTEKEDDHNHFLHFSNDSPLKIE